MAGEDEKKLVERIREKDEDARTELVARYQPQVYRWALKMVRQVEDAQDIMQEVFIRAFRGLPQYRGESKFSVWLYRITYNLSLDRLTRKRREHVPFEEEIHSPAEEPLESSREEIAAALEKLPIRYQMVLTFYYMREMSYQEIADMLNVPINTVKTHLRRAKQMLRRRMEESRSG